jgi:hypothetical protein
MLQQVLGCGLVLVLQVGPALAQRKLVAVTHSGCLVTTGIRLVLIPDPCYPNGIQRVHFRRAARANE